MPNNRVEMLPKQRTAVAAPAFPLHCLRHHRRLRLPDRGAFVLLGAQGLVFLIAWGVALWATLRIGLRREDKLAPGKFGRRIGIV